MTIGAASGLDDIKRIAMTLRVGQTGLKGTTQEADLWNDYRAHVHKSLSLRRRLKVVVDASNGFVEGQKFACAFMREKALQLRPG